MTKTITLERAVNVLSSKMEVDSTYRNNFSFIVDVLQTIFETTNVEAKFQKKLSEEAMAQFAKDIIFSFLGDRMTEEDIFKIEVFPHKKILIYADGHFSENNILSRTHAENFIADKIRIFTGYRANVCLSIR